MRIAIVEDNPKLAELLVNYLRRDGFTTDHFVDGRQALASLTANPADLTLLDLMLPGLDGMSICRDIRRATAMPIIMLTARVEEIDRLLGLELGADDYICKPFSPREVVARVKAVLRRTANAANPAIDARFALDPGSASLNIDGARVALTLVELEILKVLTARPGHIFSRSQLMGRIYPDNRIVSDRTIDSHIRKLRRKLRSISADAEHVHSVYGIGYKFEMPSNDSEGIAGNPSKTASGTAEK